MQEKEKLDNFLLFLDKSNIAELIKPKYDYQSKKGGRPPFKTYNLFATILYGFAFDKCTLRDISDACKYDLRFMYLMNNEVPEYSVFGNFINDYLIDNIDEIFFRISKTLVDEINLDISDVFLDGTKIEANANKYKFVWKPEKYHMNLSNKIRELLRSVDLSRNIPQEGIIDSKLIATKIEELAASQKYEKEYKLLLQLFLKAIEYEEKEEICGTRNSYYKSDHDATAMCLKRDYYSGLGSNMHAAYNTQILVSKGIVLSVYISQNPNDFNDLIPIIDKFNHLYGFYPKNLCADSGYGSLENYIYLEKHSINNYIKSPSWQGNISGKKPDKIRYENGSVVCLNGQVGEVVSLNNRHIRKVGNNFIKFEGCERCPFGVYCQQYTNTKDTNERIFETNIDLLRYKQESNQNLLSIKGIEMRVNRSSQAEGVFGDIKQNHNYIRLRRTTLKKVETEISLTLLGHNIRKLFRSFEGQAKFDYWKAPIGLEPEQFKKPSAKRLNKKVIKKKEKSVNQKSVDSYKNKYKKKQ